jgi:signal transduction histidine kinase
MRGTVVNQKLGQFLVLRDSSASLRLPYTSLNYFNGGSVVEVFAFHVPREQTTALTNIVVRLVSSDSSGEGAPLAIVTPTGANTNLATLSQIMQLRKLSPQEASRGYPVDISGVVTFFDPSTYMQFVQDETSGIYLDMSQGDAAVALRSGQKVRIKGFTGPGEFAPILMSQHVMVLGQGDFPAEEQVSFSKLMSGTFDSQWVLLKGVVRNQWLATNSSSLALFAGDGIVKATLPPLATEALGTNLVDASVELHGVCRTLFDEHRRLQGVELLVPDWNQLTVRVAAPQDPFTLPVKPIADLFQFHAGAADVHRVRLMGVVTYRSADGSFYLQDGSGAIRIQARQAISGLHVGALADVAGFPVIVDKLAMLQEAIGHTEKDTAAIDPTDLKADSSLDDSLQARLIRIEGRVLGRFSHGTEELLTVQFGQRIIDVVLEKDFDSVQLPALAPGTVARFTGVCLVQSDSAGNTRTFRLLLRAPGDIAVLTFPTWWTMQRTAWALGGATTVLLVALGWVGALRRQVRQRTKELHEKIEQHKRTETQLESEIVERKKMETEIERSQEELIIASRQAGMAEVATSVLHNVGNVLNSVNVSCGLIAEKVRGSKFTNIGRVADMMKANATNLPQFLENDPKGRQLPQYLGRLAEHVKTEQTVLLLELDSLRKNIEHIKGIVGVQQNYAKLGGANESVNATELVEDALRMNSGALMRHEVRVVREYQEDLPEIRVDKHKILQILVNLICNAKNACDESSSRDRLLTVRVNIEAERLSISVFDNGVGIPKDNLTRIFNHGFTTRKDGHGFGLHSGALAAREMGGTLLAHSEGLGKGAEFTLALPLHPQNEQRRRRVPTTEQPDPREQNALLPRTHGSS